MSKINLNFQAKVTKKMATAMNSNAPISLKYSLEICKFIKGKTLKRSKAFLANVVEHTEWVPLRTYNQEIGHRKGRAVDHTKTGRYPERCSAKWLELLESAEKNGDYKGLNVEKLMVRHAFASQGIARMTNQAQGKMSGKRRVKKSCHIEVVLEEAA